MGTIKEKMDSLEAVILAGGFGTRLQHIVSDVPKPMAPMDEAGTPFLKYVLADLARQGIRSGARSPRRSGTTSARC